jgi:hypothetical protein
MPQTFGRLPEGGSVTKRIDKELLLEALAG